MLKRLVRRGCDITTIHLGFQSRKFFTLFLGKLNRHSVVMALNKCREDYRTYAVLDTKIKWSWRLKCIPLHYPCITVLFYLLFALQICAIVISVYGTSSLLFYVIIKIFLSIISNHTESSSTTKCKQAAFNVYCFDGYMRTVAGHSLASFWSV